MRFLIDAMLPPDTCEHLRQRGHDAVTPTDLGAHNLPDDMLIQVAGEDSWVIVTENASDFAHAACPVVFVRKDWWPRGGLAERLAASLSRWAADHPGPGPWPQWLEEGYR